MLVEKIFNFTLLGADWVLWLLIMISVFSISIMVERAVMLYRNRSDAGALSQRLTELLAAGAIQESASFLKTSNSPEARICLTGVENVENGLGVVEEKIAAAINQEKLRMEENVSFLGTVGSNAPFIGLFGTVLGIIRAFHDLSLGSQEGTTAVMAGISQALVATAVGLLVAIPAVIAFNYFKEKVKEKLANADSLVRVVFAYMKRIPPRGAVTVTSASIGGE
ncbi:MAG: MotA/TolQ/ExbB proton channel family protein [bacterium]|nr:MotA/TolQ/ExbB proton channel family protein [bacterium]